MQTNDKKQFLETLNGCGAIYRVTLTDMQISMYWELLKEFSLNDVQSACFRHMQSAKFFPTPAELVALMPSAKHVDADEAWSIVLSSMDEAETVVMTQQMLEARGIAWPIWQSGDEIGARMAFRSAYNRMIASAHKPEWRVIVGWDSERRLPAVESAKRLGRLSADYQLNPNLLPAPAAQVTVAGLLENLENRLERSADDVQKAKQSIARMRSILNGSDQAGIEERQRQREAFEKHRQTVLDAVARKMESLH